MKKKGSKAISVIMLIVAGLMILGCGAILWSSLRSGTNQGSAAPGGGTTAATSASAEVPSASETPAEAVTAVPETPAESVTEVPTAEETPGREPVTEASAAESSAAESAETSAAETSATEDPTSGEPTSETPASGEQTTEIPSSQVPETEIPTTDAPTTEAPTTEAPTTEAPTTAAPVTEAPTTEAPTTAAPTTEAPTTAAPTTEAPTTAAPTTEAPTTAAPTTEAPTTAAPTTEAPTTAAPTTEAPTTAAPTTEAPTTAAPTTEADMTMDEAASYLAARFRQAFPGTAYLDKAQSMANSLAASKGNADLGSALAAAGLSLNGSISVQSAQISMGGTLRETVRQLADHMTGNSSAGSADGMAVGLFREGGQLYAAAVTVSGELLTASEAAQREAEARQRQIEQARALAESLNGQHMAAVNEILRLMNEERAKVGVPSLNLKTEYQPAAQVRAREIVQLFEHTRPNGSSCFTALDEKGYTYTRAGENIAMSGNVTDAASAGAALYQLWRNSSGHYANMISGDFTDVTMEVYFVEIDGVVCAYGVQLFTAP